MMQQMMDSWGQGGGMDSWGPSQGGKGGGSGPYGGKGGGKGGFRQPEESYAPPPSADSMPEINWLTIDADSKLAQAGYVQEGCAIEHSKLDVFSEAHYWCQ